MGANQPGFGPPLTTPRTTSHFLGAGTGGYPNGFAAADSLPTSLHGEFGKFGACLSQESLKMNQAQYHTAKLLPLPKWLEITESQLAAEEGLQGPNAASLHELSMAEMRQKHAREFAELHCRLSMETTALLRKHEQELSALKALQRSYCQPLSGGIPPSHPAARAHAEDARRLSAAFAQGQQAQAKCMADAAAAAQGHLKRAADGSLKPALPELRRGQLMGQVEQQLPG